jgi:DNA-binding CsgD family transcriptional regulator
VTISDDHPSPLSVLGLSAAEEAIYRALLRTPRLAPETAASVVGADLRSAAELVDRLVGTGLVMRDGDELVAAPPEQALERLITDEQQRLQAVREQLTGLRGLVPALTADYRATRDPLGEPVQVESVPIREALPMLRSLAVETDGDLLWMRHDQWRLPVGREVDDWVRDQLRQGRRSRVLYPARVLEEAPEAVRRRADLGEHVRILGALPGRLAVVGTAAAVLPQRFDVAEDMLLVLRQQSLVTAMTLLFEALWERALIVPGIGGDGEAERESARRLILDQMARGAKDEQIARTLGLSLRTVRRRVADLMDELEAGSRFQAGVEAVRRGWL